MSFRTSLVLFHLLRSIFSFFWLLSVSHMLTCELITVATSSMILRDSLTTAALIWCFLFLLLFIGYLHRMIFSCSTLLHFCTFTLFLSFLLMLQTKLISISFTLLSIAFAQNKTNLVSHDNSWSRHYVNLEHCHQKLPEMNVHRKRTLKQRNREQECESILSGLARPMLACSDICAKPMFLFPIDPDHNVMRVSIKL